MFGVFSLPGVPGRIWKVTRGAGMGLILGGDVADITFYELCERNFLLLPEVVERFSIKMYCRYKDDGFLVLGGDLTTRVTLWKELSERARYFELKLDSLSRTRATMLDLEIFKGSGWRSTGYLDYSLHTKSTSQWVPLSPSSAHAATVHINWPAGQVKRIRNRCKGKAASKKEVAKFKASYKKVTGLDLPIVKARKKPGILNQKPSRIVLPWRPEWMKASIPRILHEINGEWERELVEAGVPSGSEKVQVSWALGGQHLVQKLAAMNKHGLCTKFSDFCEVRI